MRSRVVWVLLALPSVVVLACGSGDNTSDAGLDATIDSPGVDSGGDSTVDSGMDATVDSGDSGDSGDASVDAADDVTLDAGGDAGDAGDAGDGALDDAGCGSKSGFAFASVDAGCGVGVDYSCGTDHYEVECLCVSFGECRCKKNDAGVGGLTNYGGCPTCSISPSYSALAAGCGIPY